MGKEALIIIDMLNDFVRKGAPLEVPATRRAIPAIRREIAKAHRKKNPVIYVCDAHRPDDVEFSRHAWPPHGVKGSEGARIIEELCPQEGDFVVEKKTYSVFFKTRLQSTLKKLGVDSIRLSGCVTHICILFAAYDAAVRDYGITVVEKGIAGLGKADHDAALRIMKNVLAAKVE